MVGTLDTLEVGASESPGDLVKNAEYDLVYPRWGLRVCVSYKLPGEADAAGPRFE